MEHPWQSLPHRAAEQRSHRAHCALALCLNQVVGALQAFLSHALSQPPCAAPKPLGFHCHPEPQKAMRVCEPSTPDRQKDRKF